MCDLTKFKSTHYEGSRVYIDGDERHHVVPKLQLAYQNGYIAKLKYTNPASAVVFKNKNPNTTFLSSLI